MAKPVAAAADRYRGALLGLAIGDALGAAVEFKPPGTFDLVTDMRSGGPHGIVAGEWTDDTSMALCLAESLVECRGFDPVDQLRRYVSWWREGHLSSTGRCFDIGISTRAALARFEQTGEPYCGSEDPYSAGNGSLMRLAPIPLAYAGDLAAAAARSGEGSRTTHAAAAAVDACRYFGFLLACAVGGADKAALLSPEIWTEGPLVSEVAEVASGSYRENDPSEIVGSGYVVRSLEAALWAFASTSSFEAGALAAVNLGDDADTTGAIYGQLAGVYYGAEKIPFRWRENLAHRELIIEYADRLHDLAFET